MQTRSLQDVWQQKPHAELLAALGELGSYDPATRRVLLAEAGRRNLPIVTSVAVETGPGTACGPGEHTAPPTDSASGPAPPFAGVLAPPEIEQLRECLSRLRRKDPLRPAAEALLAGLPPADDDVVTAFERLERPHHYSWEAVVVSTMVVTRARLDAGDQQRALAALGRLALRSGHRSEAGRWLRSCGWATAWFVSFYACAALCANSLEYGRYDDFLDPLIYLILILCGLGLIPAPIAALLVVSARDRSAGRRIVRSAIAALQAIGPPARSALLLARAHQVASSAGGGTADIREAAAELSRLLKDVRHDQTGWIDPQTVPQLCQTLLVHASVTGTVAHRDEQLAADILTTIEALADCRAIEAVEQVRRYAGPEVEVPNAPRVQSDGAAAQPSVIETDAAPSALRRKAAQTLEVLRARQQDDEEQRRLLRPAAAPGSDTLLRPATAGTSTPPEVLLRPAARGGPRYRRARPG